MKLWHCPGSRSLRPLWALEEMGLDYEIEILPFPPRVFQRDYLAVNPLGTVPCFVDGDAYMTESSAICQYLVERYRCDDFGLRPEHPEYGAYLNWLHHADATLTFPLTICLRYRYLEPDSQRQAVADDYIRWFLARLRRLDAHLLEHEYLVARRFTIADIAVAYALILARTLKLEEHLQDQTLGYLQRMTARPGFQRADGQGEPLVLPERAGAG